MEGGGQLRGETGVDHVVIAIVQRLLKGGLEIQRAHRCGLGQLLVFHRVVEQLLRGHVHAVQMVFLAQQYVHAKQRNVMRFELLGIQVAGGIGKDLGTHTVRKNLLSSIMDR